MSAVDDAGHPRGSKAPTIRRVLILAAAMALVLAAPASAQASWLISKRAAISDARRVVRDRGTWSADIAGDHYEMTFARTQAIYAAPKAHTQQRGTLAHAWVVGVGDPGQHDCRDVFVPTCSASLASPSRSLGAASPASTGGGPSSPSDASETDHEQALGGPPERQQL